MYTDESSQYPTYNQYYYGADSGNQLGYYVFDNSDYTFWIGVEGSDEYQFPFNVYQAIVCMA